MPALSLLVRFIVLATFILLLVGLPVMSIMKFSRQAQRDRRVRNRQWPNAATT